jgi:hypothetical protein
MFSTEHTSAYRFQAATDANALSFLLDVGIASLVIQTFAVLVVELLEAVLVSGRIASKASRAATSSFFFHGFHLVA